jgi:UDP-N-acetyl-2-amino-2-deoxyglucuronate dehydrogenase
MQKNIHVGVIGYGWAATAHIAAINATRQAQVTAVYSSRELDAAQLSELHGSPIRVYNDLEAMLADPTLHVVDITSYPHQHAAQFIAAAGAGKHVILEKPMALEWEDLLAMKNAADQAGIQTCVCFECRYSSQFLAAKRLIDSGMLGELHYAEVDYFHGIGPWYGQYRWNTEKAKGGSALLTGGCHALDALLLCMGSEVEEVTSYATQSRNPIFAAYEYPTATTTLLRFANGAVAKCAAIVDCIQPYYFRTHLVGSEGTLLDQKFHSQKIPGLERNAWQTLDCAPLDSGNVHDHPYQTQFQAFFDALDAGTRVPLTSFNDGFATQRVIAAADLSVALRRPVALREIPFS